MVVSVCKQGKTTYIECDYVSMTFERESKQKGRGFVLRPVKKGKEMFVSITDVGCQGVYLMEHGKTVETMFQTKEKK